MNMDIIGATIEDTMATIGVVHGTAILVFMEGSEVVHQADITDNVEDNCKS